MVRWTIRRLPPVSRLWRPGGGRMPAPLSSPLSPPARVLMRVLGWRRRCGGWATATPVSATPAVPTPCSAEASNVEGAVQCAVWLGITYKANFANFAAANGWIGRAERLLGPLEPGRCTAGCTSHAPTGCPISMPPRRLTIRAVELARAAGDADLELGAMSQLGLIRVGQGHVAEGFALIDEAMAAALAGERSNLDTVVYTCCDMLNACELASDLERAAQWCRVADEFVDTYGCPFLYAECRLYYGSVLLAKGRWEDADRELTAGVRITAGACPGLHARALTRLAGLRVRQGRLEDAAHLLSGVDVDGEAEATLSLAAMLLARGDAQAASRQLEQRLQHVAEHRFHLATALDLLIDACLSDGDVETAGAAAERLADIVAAAPTADSSRRWPRVPAAGC